MGADGGSIPDRRDLVRTKAKSEQTDKELLRELFFLCALSKRPLAVPVVLDPLGKLYNKDALLEYLLDKSKYGDGDLICGYLKGMKDVMTLNLTANPTYTPPDAATTQLVPLRAPFVCPLSLREMSGSVPFIALRPCGCVFSDAAIRSVIPSLTKGLGSTSKQTESSPEDNQTVNCPNCGKEITPGAMSTVMPINPRREVQDVLMEELLLARASAKAGKKRKAAAVSSEPNTNDTTAANGEARPPNKSVDNGDAASALPRKMQRTTASASPAPSGGPLARTAGNDSRRATPDPANAPTINQRQTVAQKLAEQEQKRLAAREGMSDAVKSIFAPKEPGKKDAAADFFRTFTRYA